MGSISFSIKDGPTKIQLIAAVFEGQDEVNAGRNYIEFLISMNFYKPFDTTSTRIQCKVNGIKRVGEDSLMGSDDIHFILEGVKVMGWPDDRDFDLRNYKIKVSYCSYNTAEKVGRITLEW